VRLALPEVGLGEVIAFVPGLLLVRQLGQSQVAEAKVP
jgi:hypothetical protein